MKTKTYEKLCEHAGISEPCAEYLYRKGITTPEEYDAFFGMRIAKMKKPKDMRDGTAFVETLARAVTDNKEITIYGDYDCDGIMATSIMLLGLRKISSANINWFVNNRFTEGYGMNIKGVKRMLDMYPNTEFVVTVDNGIKASEGIQYAKDKGIEVIVSDHHKQSEGEPLPNCIVVCEGRLDEPEETKEHFCGAELARRLISEVYIYLGIAKQNAVFLNGLCAYSGFATITDSVPMNKYNHEIAKVGLKLIENNYEMLWQVLNKKMKPARVNQDTIGFVYGPMFNAPGRVIGTVDAGMDVILSAADNDFEKASECTDLLKEINEERKKWASEDDEEAFAIAEVFGSDNFLVIDSETFREGINGLTASHLTEKYGVPAIVLSPVKGSDNIYKGSGRSVEGINLFDILDGAREYMLGFGGHPMAAGLSVKKEDIPKLREALNKATPPKKEVSEKADFVCDASFITLDLIQDFVKLEPYGPEFEKPLFKISGKLRDFQTMKDKHLKLFVNGNTNDDSLITMLWWNCMEIYKSYGKELTPGEIVKCIGTPEINQFRDSQRIQMVIDKIDYPHPVSKIPSWLMPNVSN